MKTPQAENGLQGALAAKPEVEIWLRVGCFRFVGERTYLCMVSEQNVRISTETAEIYRVKLGHSAQSGIA